MFDQIQISEISARLGILAFGVSFGIFLGILTLALRCPRPKVDYLAQLPLSEENNHE